MVMPRVRALSGAIAVTLVLAGCAVGPDYKPPEVKLTAFHNHADPASGTVAVPTLDRWWTGFNDATLDRVIDGALAQNLDLAAAMARVEQARAAASGAGAELLPSADLNGLATRQHQSLDSPTGQLFGLIPGYNRNGNEYTVGPAASWEVDIAGGLRRNARAARDELQAAEAEGVGTRITVAADAADAYLQVRGLQARLAVANEQVDTDTHLLDLVHARNRAGAADGREVAQAEALLRDARSTLPVLRTQLEAQLNRLDVLMGLQPGSAQSDLAEPGDIPAVPAVADAGAPVDMLRRRPDIIAAERRLAASSERIGVALSDYYPKVSLAGALGFDSTRSGNLFTERAWQPTVTGGLRWRLFDFGKVAAEVKQAKGANAEALAVFRQAALRATEDVENAFMALSQSQARRVELDAEVDALTRARDLSEHAYKSGAITLTDVLDANRQLLVARDARDDSRAGTARAAVSVFRSLGGGWDAAGEGDALRAPDAVSRQ